MLSIGQLVKGDPPWIIRVVSSTRSLCNGRNVPWKVNTPLCSDRPPCFLLGSEFSNCCPRTRGPTKSDFRYRYIATKILYRPGIPSTILYYRSRKYARINIDVYAAELSVSQYKKCMKELATK